MRLTISLSLGPLKVFMPCSQLLAYVATRDRQAERSAVPLQPVKSEVVGDKAVVHLVGLTVVQKLHGRQQFLAKDLPSQPRCRR